MVRLASALIAGALATGAAHVTVTLAEAVRLATGGWLPMRSDASSLASRPTRSTQTSRSPPKSR